MNRRAKKILERLHQEDEEERRYNLDWPKNNKKELDELNAKLDELKRLSSACDGGCGGGRRWCTHEKTRTLRAHIMDQYGVLLLCFYQSQYNKIEH